MRLVTLALLVFLVSVGGLIARNSREMLSQTPQTSSSPQQPSTPPADNARRIGAKEAHDVLEKGDAIVIDTRAESLYKEEHIKGSISMPAETVLARVDKLPRNKLIIAYCT